MFFKPKFCCNCGEVIERDQWRLWTSRRFCELCETEFKGQDLIPRAIVVVALLVGVAGMGAAFRDGGGVAASAERPTAMSLVGGRGSDKGGQQRPSNGGVADPQAGATEEPATTSEQPASREKSSEQEVHFCEATTKKGKPCSRRVKSKGYCWQHERASADKPAQTHSRPTASF